MHSKGIYNFYMGLIKSELNKEILVINIKAMLNPTQPLATYCEAF